MNSTFWISHETYLILSTILKPNNSSYFLFFKGEIWANLEHYAQTKYDKYGTSTQCINGNYMMVGLSTKPEQCGLFTGTQMTNYVYKVTRYNTKKVKCPYFEARGCWADSNPWLKPDKRTMTVYRMNERDPSISKLFCYCCCCCLFSENID